MARHNRSDVRRSFGSLDDAVMLDTKEVAEIIGVTPFCVRNWRRHDPKKGPRYRTMGPNIVRYTVGDVKAWMNACARSTPAAE